MKLHEDRICRPQPTLRGGTNRFKTVLGQKQKGNQKAKRFYHQSIMRIVNATVILFFLTSSQFTKVLHESFQTEC